MSHKRGYHSNFTELMLDLEKLKENAEGIWEQAMYAKEKTMLAHHRLKSDPRLLPCLFTQNEKYQKGRALIAFEDRKAILSQEEADLRYYQKLMSNKYADGSDSDRKKPQMFLTRDQLSNTNVKRVVAKFCRDFGCAPIGRENLSTKSKICLKSERSSVGEKRSHWRQEVNDFVLGRFVKIYSPHNLKKKADSTHLSTLSSLCSESGSPHYESLLSPTHIPRLSLLSLSHLPNSPKKDIESMNIKHEIKKSRKDMVDLKLSMGFSKLRDIEIMKLKSASKHNYN